MNSLSGLSKITEIVDNKNYKQEQIDKFGIKYEILDVSIPIIPYISPDVMETGIKSHLQEVFEHELQSTLDFWEVIATFCHDNLAEYMDDENRKEILALCVTIIKTYGINSFDVLNSLYCGVTQGKKRQRLQVSPKASFAKLFKKNNEVSVESPTISKIDVFYNTKILPVIKIIPDILNKFIGPDRLCVTEPIQRSVNIDATHKVPTVTFQFQHPILVRCDITTQNGGKGGSTYSFMKISANDWTIMQERLKQQITAKMNLIKDILNYPLTIYSAKDKNIYSIDSGATTSKFNVLQSVNDAYFFLIDHISIYWDGGNPKVKTYLNSGFFISNKSKLGNVLRDSGLMD